VDSTLGPDDAHSPDRLASSWAEDRKTVYQATIQLMVYEGTVLWTRLNAMIVLNALLIATATLLVQGKIGHLAALPPLLGALLSALLGATIYRGQDFHRYWEATAADLEDTLPAENLKVVSNNVKFRKDGQIQIGSSQPLKLHLPKLRARVAILLVTGLLIGADALLAGLIFNATSR
jgi:hypothetical protein